jgi:cation-transporting ATPase E
MLSYGIPEFGLDQTVKEAGGAVIGMIPSGMFLLTSIALASAVIKLSKKQTMVRDLYCIEMLARVDTLCLDKTGTITDGTMQVKEVVGYKGDEDELKNVVASFLAATDDNNQTAIALANYYGKKQGMTPLSVVPFSSQRKLSAVTFDGEGTYFLGAPEFVIPDLPIKTRKKIEDYARGGYRVLLFARSPYDIKDDKLPSSRKEICYFVVEDHIRPEAYDTIKWFKENKVTVKVISGDNPLTVSEIAAKVGVENADKFISLEGMSNQQVREVANRYTVFGRVTPEQKRILVTAMKADKHTVAMTGDGVNDILALREADCSVAMASGSEAARNVSHLVLMNSDFSSMPEVVKEGRRVINNIQNSSSLYLMKTFMSVILSILAVVFVYCNIITDRLYFFDTSSLISLEFCIIGLPSVFLALQPNDALVEGKFLSNILRKCLAGGVAMVLAVLSVYLYKTFGLAAGLDGGSFDSVYPRAYDTMLVVSVLYTGFMSLVVICKPFDSFRAWVCVGTFAFATFFLTGIVGLLNHIGLGEVVGNIEMFLNLDFQFLTFIATVILVNYFVIMLITKALNNLMSKKKGEQHNGNQRA